MRTAFITALLEQAKKDGKIFLLTPDMGFSVFEKFAEAYPERFLNTGIAEQNTIGIAAGLALSGFKPYIYSIAPFVLMRCYEQVRLDISYMNLNIKIIGAGGGFAYGAAGASHQIIEDFAITKVLPNFIVCSPADPVEAAQIFEQSFITESPMYIRLAKNNEPLIHDKNDKITIGKAFRIKEGGSLEIITTGTITQRVLEWNVNAGVTVFHSIKPLDTDYLDKLISSNKDILVVEEHNVIGGLGESISSYMAQNGAKNKIKLLGVNDVYSHYIGNRQYILEKMGLWNIHL